MIIILITFSVSFFTAIISLVFSNALSSIGHYEEDSWNNSSKDLHKNVIGILKAGNFDWQLLILIDSC